MKVTPTVIAVENLKRGSEQAKEFIFINYYGDFLRVAVRILKCKEDAEDVISEAFFKIFNRIHQLKDSNQFVSWCRCMIIRDCYNFIRARKLDSDLDLVDITVFDDFSKNFDVYLIKREIQKLPTGYGRVVQLHCVEGYSGAEVSKMLHIEPATVRSQLMKARRMLHKRLGYEY